MPDWYIITVLDTTSIWVFMTTYYYLHRICDFTETFSCVSQRHDFAVRGKHDAPVILMCSTCQHGTVRMLWAAELEATLPHLWTFWEIAVTLYDLIHKTNINAALRKSMPWVPQVRALHPWKSVAMVQSSHSVSLVQDVTAFHE